MFVVKIQVRHNHHQGIPTFSCRATSWEEANEKLSQGLDAIRKNNEQYFSKHEGQYALICGIIDFQVVTEDGAQKGQFGFSIDSFDKTIKEYIDWYCSLNERSVVNG